jgi:hypothetical protein
LKPAAPASEHLAFPNASSRQNLPFSNYAFEFDQITYTTTPVLLQTYAAVATPSASATRSANATIATSTTPPLATFTGAGSVFVPDAAAGLAAAVGVAAAIL